MKKQSILIINRVYPPSFGATGQMAYDLVQHLSRQGHFVTVLTTSDDPSIKADPNVTVKKIKSVKEYRKLFGFLWLWIKLLWASLKIKKHDVIITLTDPPLIILVGSIYSSFKKSKHIHWCHDLYPDLFPQLGVRLPNILQSFLKSLSSRAMFSADCIVTISHCMKRYLLQEYSLKKDIQVISNWAPTEVMKISHFSKKRLQVKSSKSSEQIIRDDQPKFRVLYAGHFGRAHLVNPILNAAEQLKECPEIEFTFVCQKHIHERLSIERDRRGLENITLVPLQPSENISSIIESGDIHIVTMRDTVEGMLLPSKFYASLIVARPVIFVGPKNNDIFDIIQHYKMGTVVPLQSKQEEVLAQAIFDYRMDSDLWLNAQKGALAAAENFNYERSMNQWSDVLQRIK